MTKKKKKKKLSQKEICFSERETLFVVFSTLLSETIDFSDACKNCEDYSELIYLMKQKFQFCN